jgi:4-amino-4-deoxy-L-arabinose transferase-like glycosyltransferase
VACFVLLALRHVDGQDATYDEGFYFGVGRTLLRQGTWEGVVLLHPPLSYYVASLPLLAMDAEASARDPRQLLLCRLSMLVGFGVPILLIVHAWAERLYGPTAGLVALTLAAFSPTLLAHAPLITPDAALTATGLLALYLYWRAGPDGPVWPWGAALGLALLTKVSAVLFLAALVLLELSRVRARGVGRTLRRVLGALALAWLVLNVGYGFAGLLDARGKAAMLAKVPPLPGLRLAAHAAAPFFPLPYLRCVGRQTHIGMDGRPGYLQGEVSSKGWWRYYLVALLVKETLPFLLLLAAALVSLFRLRPSARDEPVLLLPPLLFFGFFSLNAVQIGIRYVLPALPFLFVFVARLLRLPWAARAGPRLALLALVAGHAALSVRGGPDYIAYFNELAGGPAGGIRYLGDSNLDWGQNRSRAEDYARRTGAVFQPPLLPPHGRVVLSTNRIQGFMDPPRYRLLRDEYRPSERVGWNWLVYDLDRDRRFTAEAMLPVLSGTEWLAGAATGDTWTRPGFDAGAWSPAAVASDDGLPLPEAFPGTEAVLMTCPGGAPDCGFRRAIELRSRPAQAILYMATRGEYQLYANGRRVAAGTACASAFRREQHRLTDALQAGTNVLALRAAACGERAPRAFVEMRVARE